MIRIEHNLHTILSIITTIFIAIEVFFVISSCTDTYPPLMEGFHYYKMSHKRIARIHIVSAKNPETVISSAIKEDKCHYFDDVDYTIKESTTKPNTWLIFNKLSGKLEGKIELFDPNAITYTSTRQNESIPQIPQDNTIPIDKDALKVYEKIKGPQSSPHDYHIKPEYPTIPPQTFSLIFYFMLGLAIGIILGIPTGSNFTRRIRRHCPKGFW